MNEAEAIIHHEPPTLYLRTWIRFGVVLSVPILLVWWVGFPHPLSAALVLWAAAFTGLATALYYLARRDALHPASMFGSIWCLLFWIYAFSPVDLDVASNSTILLIFLGVATFGVGCYTGARPILFRRANSHAPCKSLIVQNVLIGYSVLVGLWFAVDVWKLGSSGQGFAGHIIAARDAIITSFILGKNPYSNPLVSTAPMVITLTALILQADRATKRKRMFMFILAFVIGVLTTGRTFLVELFVGSLVIHAVMKRPDRRFMKLLKQFLPVATAAIALLSGIALLTKQETQAADGVVALIGKSLVIYLIGGVPAFDFARSHPTMFSSSANLVFADFRWLVAPFSRPAEIPMFLPWINIPIPINVYTVFYDFYISFGYLGTLLAMFVCGAVCGNIYFRAARGGLAALVFYCMLAYAIAMSGFVNGFRMFTTFAQVALFIAAYFKLSRLDRGTRYGLA